jgi:hypothetical protein
MAYNKDDDHFWGLRARRYKARVQPTLRSGATHIGNFKTCKLPKCRRSKQCLGCYPTDEIGTTYWKGFPPCITDDAGRMELKRGLGELAEMGKAEMRARGEDVEAWMKSLYEGPDPFDDPE